MPPIHVEITATVVAWYAAVVGTLSLFVAAHNAWRDRARIVVRARPGYIVPKSNPGLYDPSAKYISITVANRGRRPRTIDRVGFKLRTKGCHLVATDPFSPDRRNWEKGRPSAGS
jgi:hypothetical protein